MKFKLLSIGQKFEYEGETYVKTSPLIASNTKTNQNKIIPRYVTLTLLDEIGGTKKIKNETINTQNILNAFNVFYEKCISELENKNINDPEIKNEFDKARDEFIKQLF